MAVAHAAAAPLLLQQGHHWQQGQHPLHLARVAGPHIGRGEDRGDQRQAVLGQDRQANMALRVEERNGDG